MKKNKKNLKADDIKKYSCNTCTNELTDVRSDAFAFCRYGVMLIVWVAFLLKVKWLVLLTFGILLLSAVFSIKYAPMIMIYNYTIGMFFKYKTEKLGIGGMRFAHILGSIFAGIAVLFLYLGNLRIGWAITFLLAIMKTVSAFGLCPAYKLYNCMKSGGCCSFIKKLSK